MENLTEEMRNTFKEEWEKCNHLYRFEAWAQLYYDRFHRLIPGKSYALRDSNDEENREMVIAWHASGLAEFDAIMEIVRLNEIVKNLKYQLLDCSEELSSVWKHQGQINPNIHAEEAEKLADSTNHL